MNIRFAILFFAFIITSVCSSVALAYGAESVAKWLGSTKTETIKDRLLNEIIVVQAIQKDPNIQKKIAEEDQRLQLNPWESQASAYAIKEVALVKTYNCMNTAVGFVDEKELFEHCFFKDWPLYMIDEFKNNSEFGRHKMFNGVLKDIYNLALNEQKRENKEQE